MTYTMFIVLSQNGIINRICLMVLFWQQRAVLIIIDRKNLEKNKVADDDLILFSQNKLLRKH